MIPLYLPNAAPKLPEALTSLHWKEVQTTAEERLRGFLEVHDDCEVMLVDRATHGLELLFLHFRERYGLHVIRIPNRTYRSVQDAAISAGFAAIQYDSSIKVAPSADYLAVPSTLGGLAIDSVWSRSSHPCVIDCAHTAFPGMFRDPQPLPLHTAAVLSFYPTKPLGAFGGGAIVARRELVAALRPWSEPGAGPCRFYYPQTVQSFGVTMRVLEYERSSKEWYQQLKRRWVAAAGMLLGKFSLRPAWSAKTPASPHLLAVTGRRDRLRDLATVCRVRQIETGAHYPPLNGRGEPHVTVPFWSSEFIQMLEEHGV